MAEFTVTITDQVQLDGIAWAREQHNLEADQMKGNRPEYPAEFPYTATDQEYVQWVMDRASLSYARQKASAPPPEPPEPPGEPAPDDPPPE